MWGSFLSANLTHSLRSLTAYWIMNLFIYFLSPQNQFLFKPGPGGQRSSAMSHRYKLCFSGHAPEYGY